MSRRPRRVYAATYVELGERLRARRVALGIAMPQLGRCTGMHWSHLHRIERGETNPTLETLLRVIAALGIDLADLFDGLPLAPDTTEKEARRDSSSS